MKRCQHITRLQSELIKEIKLIDLKLDEVIGKQCYLEKIKYQLDVDFSYCWLNLVEAWYSLEQYIGLKEDKLSSTTVDFIRSGGNLET